MIRYLLLALVAASLAITFCLSAVSAAEPADPVVVIETKLGKIKVQLNPQKAPITVKNFLGYVDDKYYDGLIFHRVIADFMIQGGGFTPDMKQKETTRPAIKNEAANGLINERGTIAMARTSDPDSATSQFFINTVDNKGLDKENCQDGFGYCVFGKVIDGMDVVDKIRAVKTGQEKHMGDVPVDKAEVTIISIKRLEK